jgi:hypothetical protein
MNLESLEARLKEKYGNRGISKRDVLSSALYPKVGSFLLVFFLLGLLHNLPAWLWLWERVSLMPPGWGMELRHHSPAYSRVTPLQTSQVFEEYMTHVMRYSNLVEKLPTRAFLVPLADDEDVEIELAKVRCHIDLRSEIDVI